MRNQAIKAIEKLNNKLEPQVAPITEQLADIIENMPEQNQLHSVVIVCTHILAGFEDVNTRNEVINLIKMLSEQIAENEKELRNNNP